MFIRYAQKAGVAWEIFCLLVMQKAIGGLEPMALKNTPDYDVAL